jgi:hypothetical protein
MGELVHLRDYFNGHSQEQNADTYVDSKDHADEVQWK